MLNVGPAATATQRALINTPPRRVAALRVKSTGWLVLGTVKVAVTGLIVPGVNAGILTTAFVAVVT